MTSKLLTVIHILYSLEVGAALLMLPWLGIWDHNLVLYACPRIEPVVTSSFFKGAVVGLGIDNILIAIHEIVHFRSGSRGFFSS